MHGFDGSLTLLVVVLGAFVVPLIAARYGFPAVVGEIIFGLLLGPTFLGGSGLEIFEFLDPTHEQSLLTFLADFGFLLLMFMAGLEIDFDLLAQQGRNALIASIVYFLAACGLAWYAATLLGLSPFYALILATVSVGLVLPILREYRMGRTAVGQILLLTAIMADFLTIIAVTIYDLVFQYGVSMQVLTIGLLFVAAGIVLWGLKLLIWWYPHYFTIFFEHEHAAEIGVRGAFALLFIFAAIASLVHIELILGAFLAGAMISLLFRNTGHLASKLSGVSFGFFVPVFFINVGRELDLSSLSDPAQLKLLGGLVLAAYLCKLIPSVVLIPLGLSIRQTLAAGFLLATPFSLSIAAAEIGLRLGILSESDRVSIILLAVVTALLSPMAFKLLMAREMGDKSASTETGLEGEMARGAL